MENTKRKRGFTLVELITVIAMLLLLMGAVTSSVSGARRRAKIQGWKEAGESDLSFVLGKEAMPNGREGNVPVLFNGAVRGGKIRDPWGNPYRFRIMSSDVDQDDQAGNVSDSAFMLPNINRIPASEVN